MSPDRLVWVVVAEIAKLLSRLSARGGLLVLVLLGIAGPLALGWLASSGMVVNGAYIADSIDKDAATGLAWALELRNFFLLRTMLVVLAATSLAGELSARTVREDLLRPVPRWAVLFGKWFALVVWIGLGLTLQWLTAATMGLVAHGTAGSLGESLVVYAAAGATDAVFAALVLAIAALTRNVAGTVAGTMLVYLFSVLAGTLIYILTQIPASFDPNGIFDALEALYPWLPSTALIVWRQAYFSTDLVWQSWASLLLLGLGAALLGGWRFQRMEVP